MSKQKGNTSIITISLPTELVERLDAYIGKGERSRLITRLLETELDKREKALFEDIFDK